MASYQVLARKYRPQSFEEVLGQSPIVTTLKNAIKFNRLAHAYLFCGSRGTGKTTLARVFAKALNCQHPTNEREPCNTCSSCKEIASGNSLDVLEIDGASHRGIDDIRQINETVGYSSSSGKYKIYIIDEVHMLTKEAFNALLKTLEEPPAKVLFIFATTEPHKILPTILSRCQRFNLSRIPLQTIIQKLARIAKELNIEVEEEALHLIAHRAEGGLRDAESLFDQIIAFHEGCITTEMVTDAFGIMSKDTLFELDRAGKEGNQAIAFEIVYQIFSQGKDIVQFIESMIEHFRTILLIKISGINAPFINLSELDKTRYELSSKIYTQEQCLTLLDYLIESQSKIKTQISLRIALEAILLYVIRIHQRLPIEFLVRRLSELEKLINEMPTSTAQITPLLSPPKLLSKDTSQHAITGSQAKASAPPIELSKKHNAQKESLTEDPHPTPTELGIKSKSKTTFKSPSPSVLPDKPSFSPPSTPSETIETVSSSQTITLSHKPHRYDTILQFAAVELEGTIQKNKSKHFNKGIYMGSGFAKKKKQAKALKEQLTQMQTDIQKSEAIGSAGNGLVTLTLSGENELKNIKIKPECVDPEDVEGLQDLIKAAYADAIAKLNAQTSMPIMKGGMPDLSMFGL